MSNGLIRCSTISMIASSGTIFAKSDLP
jgi:hypothetical protein